MKRSAGRGFFLANVAIIGVVLTLAMAQVPQPWRGYLVVWLLLSATAGTIGLRITRHHRSKPSHGTAEVRHAPERARRARRRPSSAGSRLRIVHRPVGEGRRHVI